MSTGPWPDKFRKPLETPTECFDDPHLIHRYIAGRERSFTMTFEDCIRYIEKTPCGFLATVEGDKPRVRPMTVWLADGSGIYFYTSAVKPLASQLMANPNVEIAFHQPGMAEDIGTILRIAGRIELVEDLNIRKRLYETFDWLKQIGTGTPDSPTVLVFRIPFGRFNFWSWENNVNPGPWVTFPRE